MSEWRFFDNDRDRTGTVYVRRVDDPAGFPRFRLIDSAEANELAELLTTLSRRCDTLSRRCDKMEACLSKIVAWAEAYPRHVFPEPDDEYYRRAHEVLTANGMTLDRLSAAGIRDVVEGFGKIAREALS